MYEPTKEALARQAKRRLRELQLQQERDRLAGELEEVKATIRRLRNLVEPSYKDGWGDGYSAGLSDGHPLTRPATGDREEDWRWSDAHEALEKIMAPSR